MGAAAVSVHVGARRRAAEGAALQQTAESLRAVDLRYNAERKEGLGVRRVSPQPSQTGKMSPVSQNRFSFATYVRMRVSNFDDAKN